MAGAPGPAALQLAALPAPAAAANKLRTDDKDVAKLISLLEQAVPLAEAVQEKLDALQEPRPQHATNEESTGCARRRAAARSPNGSEDAMSTTSSVGSWPWRRRRAP